MLQEHQNIALNFSVCNAGATTPLPRLLPIFFRSERCIACLPLDSAFGKPSAPFGPHRTLCLACFLTCASRCSSEALQTARASRTRIASLFHKYSEAPGDSRALCCRQATRTPGIARFVRSGLGWVPTDSLDSVGACADTAPTHDESRLCVTLASLACLCRPSNRLAWSPRPFRASRSTIGTHQGSRLRPSSALPPLSLAGQQWSRSWVAASPAQQPALQMPSRKRRTL
jgi:hypothetical protein